MKIKFKRSYFALPYTLLCAVFVVVPLAIVIIYAFTGDSGKFSFENFVYFFSSPVMQNVLLRSLLTALVTTVICLLLGYPLALALANTNINRSAIVVMMFVLPMWINSLLRIFSIQNLLGMLSIGNGFAAVEIGLVYDFFPFMLLPLYNSIKGIDKSYIEASKDLGGNSWNTFGRVVLPLSVPGIVSGVLMVFMPTVSTFAVSDILGDTSTYMFGNIINEFFASEYTWNVGATFAFIMLVLIVITMAIANRLTRGSSNERNNGGVL